MEDSEIHFICFGKLDDNSLLYSFCNEEKYHKKFAQEAVTIIAKLQPSKVSPADVQKNKSPNGLWHSIFDDKRITYMVLIGQNYPEEYVFRMLSEVRASVQEEIPYFWQKNEAETTSYARTFVPEIMEKFRSPKGNEQIGKIQGQLDQVMSTTSQAIKSTFDNIGDLENLSDKSQKLSFLSKQINDDSYNLAEAIRKRQNRNRLIVLGSIVTVFVLGWLLLR